jgi:hypothetical protein
MLYEGDIQIYNITAPTDIEVFTTEFLTTTEQQTTTEPLMTSQRLTTTEYVTTTDSLTTTEPPTTTELSSTTEPPASTELTSVTEPPTTTELTTTEPPITIELTSATEPLTSAQPPITTRQPTVGTTKDQTENMNPPATTTKAVNTAPPLTVEGTNATTPSDVDAHTRPITITTDRRPTTPEGSISTTFMNEPTTTTESLRRDIEHTTISDRTIMTTVVVPDKKKDRSIVIVDSKLAIYLSASSLAISFVLPTITIAIFTLVVVLFCTYKKKAKESDSANIELTGMREFTTETMKAKHASNIYTSPTHNHHSSEEKLDLM